MTLATFFSLFNNEMNNSDGGHDNLTVSVQLILVTTNNNKDVEMSAYHASVPWYLFESEYERFRAAATDPGAFFDTFEQWRLQALEHEAQAAKRGVVIVRICMHLDQVNSWLQLHAEQNSAVGRSKYAEMRMQQLLANQ